MVIRAGNIGLGIRAGENDNRDPAKIFGILYYL